MMSARAIAILTTLLLAFTAPITYAQTRPSWSQIRNTPTTVDGYGVTDALKTDLSNATDTVNQPGATALKNAIGLGDFYFSGGELTIDGKLNVSEDMTASTVRALGGGVVSTGPISTSGSMQIGGQAAVAGDVYSYGRFRGDITAANADITSIILGYNNSINIATATVNRLTGGKIEAGDVVVSGDVIANRLISAQYDANDLSAKNFIASTAVIDLLLPETINASAAQIIDASTVALQADNLTAANAAIASVTADKLFTTSQIQALAGMKFGDKILMNSTGRKIEHVSSKSGLGLSDTGAAISVDDPGQPGVTIASVNVSDGGVATVFGKHFNASVDTASLPANVTMTENLRVGDAGYGVIATHELTAIEVNSPMASHTQRLSAQRLNFLSSMTHEDIPGSYITADPITGAVQHFYNDNQLLTLGAAGVSVSDIKINNSIAIPVPLGSAGQIDVGQWRVGDGVSNTNLVISDGNLQVNGDGKFGGVEAQLASTSVLIASQAVVASAAITRLEVDELITQSSVGTSSVILADSTASSSLPIAFKDPNHPHDRSLDSGIYSPDYGSLAFWVDNPAATRPWLEMLADSGVISGNVVSITKPVDSASGITYSGGTIGGGGSIYLGIDSNPYCMIRNGSTALVSTYNDYVTIGTADFESDYILVVGGDQKVTGKTTSAGGINVAMPSAPASPQNGDMYYDTTAKKFKGYVDGSWVDLH